MWEDISNSAGGRWLLQLPPAKNNSHIDDYWKNIVRTQLLFLIQFETKNIIILDNEYYW